MFRYPEVQLFNFRRVAFCLAMWFADAAVGQRPVEQQNLFEAVHQEEKIGTFLAYSQRFLDEDKRDARYQGTVFQVIQSIEIEGCFLQIGILAQDRFSGVVSKRAIDNQSDTYRYSFKFELTKDLANSLRLVEARPIQLQNGTNPLCPENVGCDLLWINMKSDRALIKETRFVNDDLDFEGPVRSMFLPVSSASVGKTLISKFAALARVCKADNH